MKADSGAGTVGGWCGGESWCGSRGGVGMRLEKSWCRLGSG